MAAPTTWNPAQKTVRVLNVLELRRVSTNKQDLERQDGDLSDNRDEYNLNPLRRFDIKESGEKALTTDDIAELVEELKRPGVDGVSISAIDRFARPQDLESYGFFQKFIDLKKVIVSKREGLIEPWTPQGRKTLIAALTQADGELSALKDRLKSNRRKMHKQHKMCNTTPPYGMVYVDKYGKGTDGKRYLDGKTQYFREDERPSSVGMSRREIVIMVFNWRWLNKWRTGRIKRELNRMGILTAGKPGQYEPGPWSRSTVIQLLKNRHYIGEHWEKDDHVECDSPQLIERAVFNGVQLMFKEAQMHENGKPETKHLLCGYLFCGVCGRAYRATSGRYPAYVCGNYCYKLDKQICRANEQVRCNRIEEVVWRVVWGFLTQPDLLLANAQAYYDSLPKPTGLAKLEAEIVSLKEDIRRTQKMVKAGAYDEDQGMAEILEAKQRVREIEGELHAAGSVFSLPQEHLVRAACSRITEGDVPETFEERRPIFEKLVNLTFTYDKGFVLIEGKVPVASVEQKCEGRVLGHNSSVLYIPFKTKIEVAQPPRMTREVALSIWEKRRKNGTVTSLSGEAMREAARKGWETRRKRRVA